MMAVNLNGFFGAKKSRKSVLEKNFAPKCIQEMIRLVDFQQKVSFKRNIFNK